MTNNYQDVKKRFKIIIPEEWSNRQKGEFWEDVSAPLFRRHRWKAIQDVEFEGMQTDIYVKNLDTGEKGLVECKFQKDPISAPIIQKLLGQVIFNKCKYGYLLSTSELASTSKALIEGFEYEQVKLVFWGPDQLADIFIDINCINLPDIYQEGIGRIETITLLVTHTKDLFWIAEEIGDNGYTGRVIIFPIKNNYFTVEEWKKYFAEHSISWANLNINIITKNTSILRNNQQLQSNYKFNNIIVSKINQADSFDDYHRPCRPQDFFGRDKAQEKFWRFIKNVRDKETELRVVCFPGSTGVGKSSLVLKLASNCSDRNDVKDNFYIHHVDVTSVDYDRASLFINAVIAKAFQEAVNNKFIDITDHKILVESTEPPFLSSNSIKLALENLKVNQRVIVIFFDQFEEILTKESLSTLYDLFKIVAYEVDALKENIVLGFCWRTDINLPVKHTAYYTWHDLERIRKDIEFDEFSYQDSLNLLEGFSDYLKQKRKRLDPKIKKWLSENCQNLPWLLKKLCGDIYNQNFDKREMSSIQKKLITKFDIKKIFDADIQRYSKSPEHRACLEYVAKQAPVPIIEVCNKFNHDVINSLVRAKLIIETGENYKIYWDIFREYFLEGILPIITITYRPRTRISTLLKIFRLLKPAATKLEELLQKTDYENSTVDNAIQDLQNFFQVEKDKSNNYILVPEHLISLQDDELADHLADHIEDHIVIREIYENNKPNQCIWYDDFKNLLRRIYSEEGSIKPETPKNYSSKMLSWFCFAGLLEIRQDWLIARPIRPRSGKQKGKVSQCEFDKRKRSKSKVHEGQLELFDN